MIKPREASYHGPTTSAGLGRKGGVTGTRRRRQELAAGSSFTTAAAQEEGPLVVMGSMDAPTLPKEDRRSQGCRGAACRRPPTPETDSG